jgi:GTP cyclohydrolase II
MPEVAPSISLTEPILLSTKFGEFWLRHAAMGGKSGIVLVPNFDFDEYYVRVQSSCVFSESFSSIDCDCAHQLSKALEIIGARGGCVVYVFEEGRGAGLETKIRAIELQQRLGVDTVVAFRTLGMPPDLRDHEFAALTVRQVTAGRPVVLLTNNPTKVSELAARGVDISRRESLIAADTALTKRYLAEKSKVLGHVLAEEAEENDGGAGRAAFPGSRATDDRRVVGRGGLGG